MQKQGDYLHVSASCHIMFDQPEASNKAIRASLEQIAGTAAAAINCPIKSRCSTRLSFAHVLSYYICVHSPAERRCVWFCFEQADSETSRVSAQTTLQLARTQSSLVRARWQMPSLFDFPEELRGACKVPPPPQELAAVQQQENNLHSDEDHAGTMHGAQRGRDSPTIRAPRRPATAKAPTGGKAGSRSGKRSQRRALGMPLAPVVVATAVGLPLVVLHFLRRCGA